MYKIVSLILIIICCSITNSLAKKQLPKKSDLEVTYSKNATHIARISQDTIVVASGSTYAYTVDTPEDKGLISTAIGPKQLLAQLTSKNGNVLHYEITDASGKLKIEELLVSGDRLKVANPKNKNIKTYFIAVKKMALPGKLWLEKESLTANSQTNLTLYFTASQRTPNATVTINFPAGINITLENTTINVIGRGDVLLKNLSNQSIGRVGAGYPYKQVGLAAISKSANGGSVLVLSNLDLRPANGPDVKLTIQNSTIPKAGSYAFKANYIVTQPEILLSPGTGPETAILQTTQSISDFTRKPDKSLTYLETPNTYTQANFTWSQAIASTTELMQSLDKGKTWSTARAELDAKTGTARVTNLTPEKLYTFRLRVKNGVHKGYSNAVQFYSGKLDIKSFGVTGEDKIDNTDQINEAINYLHSIGGGTLLFSEGTYNVRTVHLKSNVYLYLSKGATIKALKGADAPETTWFSDKKYRSGLSPTDKGPYNETENWLTKQDVGHHYFRNTMFFGERLDNVKIIGNGRITGNGNLANSDRVMNNAADSRADKMFTLKLCTNLEIGGIPTTEDLWYDSIKDEPYYIRKDGSKNYNVDNMLQIDRGGHFVLLATGTDTINVHNSYFGKLSQSGARDIYDFMGCNNVKVTNIYSKVSSDDIVKPGSDCALGFTRPARNYKVRNIIGDTNCNLFQIGSETADDIMDVHVDNIYVTGANKAGFSISTNDGGHIKDIHLNCGHTGSIHSRSKMFRTTTPFFISISNRGRILGAEVGRYKFVENGEKHDELLVKNVNIGIVENIILNGIDVAEIYGGSSYGDTDNRWKPYTPAKHKKATPIVAGYKLPDTEVVEGGLNFKLPNGQHTGYIKNISFTDVQVLAKGGNPVTDAQASPPELGVGQYNVSNLKVQPAYGLWARHVMGLRIKDSSFNYEKRDSRYALFLDDVIGADIERIKMVKPIDLEGVIKMKNASAISIKEATYFTDAWGISPVILPTINQNQSKGIFIFPSKTETKPAVRASVKK